MWVLIHHVHLFSKSSQTHTPSKPTQLDVFFHLKPMKANVCCPDIPQSGDFPIEYGQLTRGYTLKIKRALHLPGANGCQ